MAGTSPRHIGRSVRISTIIAGIRELLIHTILKFGTRLPSRQITRSA